MMTRAKREMLANSRSDLASWINALKEDPDSVLRAAGHTINHALWRSEDLLAIYDPDGKGKVTPNGISRELSRQGFTRAADGMGVRTLAGQVKLWHIRNLEENVELSNSQLGALYDSERSTKSKGTKK
jgi:hypothetical protein